MRHSGRRSLGKTRAGLLALIGAVAGTGLLVAGLTGCEEAQASSTGGGEKSVYSIPIFGEYDYDQPLELKRGEELYVRHCSGCHGIEGDGKGPAAKWLNPKPRDFTQAQYKFSSTPSGKLPTDDDILHTLYHGLDGTSMPEWRLLPEPDRRAVVAYLKTFSDRWTEDELVAAIPVTTDPYENDPAGGIADGEYVYHAVATCWNCHPAYISEELTGSFIADEGQSFGGYRSDPYHSAPPVDYNNGAEQLRIPDFTYDYIKTGTDLKQLYYRIGAGISGTAMPMWSGVLSDADIWAMSHYVKYLQEEHRVWPRTPEQEAQTFGETHPDGVYPILFPEEAETE